MLFGGRAKDPMDVVEQALKERGWVYDRRDEETVTTGCHTSRDGKYGIIIRHEAGRKTILFLFVPMVADDAGEALSGMLSGRMPFFQVHEAVGHTPDQIGDACKVLMHMNYRLLLGNLERDHRDGEIRYRIALPYRDAALTVEQVNWCIDIGLGTMDDLMPRLRAFLQGEISLEDAAGIRPGETTGASGGMMV
ncbi:MAG: YbjN domain-containing protein [Armatimonadetes bacterium]|nr:YbjN domain-containing protein [Armatimonadota bacterium]